MKYILMMTGTKALWDSLATWPKGAFQKQVEFMRKFNQELAESGELVSTVGLAMPADAKVVRAGKGGEPITDGIFPESKEFLAGYWIIDVESADRAQAIAARASMAPGADGSPLNMPIEVRPVMSGPPPDFV